MPRPGPRRPYVALRIQPELLAWIDREAKRRDTTRSEMMRTLLAYAKENMPR